MARSTRTLGLSSRNFFGRTVCQFTFFLLSSAASFRSSAYKPAIQSAAPFVNTGAGLLFAYWMYFLINATPSTSTFFAACPPRVFGCLPAVIPTWRSGSYFSNGLVSTASFVVVEEAGLTTDRGCERVSGIGVPSSTPGGRYRCIRSTWSAIWRSFVSSMSSVTTNRRSNRESSESGSAMFLWGSL